MQTLARTLLFSALTLGLTACTSTNCSCEPEQQATPPTATTATQQATVAAEQQRKQQITQTPPQTAIAKPSAVASSAKQTAAKSATKKTVKAPPTTTTKTTQQQNVKAHSTAKPLAFEFVPLDKVQSTKGKASQAPVKSTAKAATAPKTSGKGQPAPKTLPGVYFARLPCPGCDSVRVNLVLEANNRYDKAEEYLASNEIFFENGQWRYNNGRIELTPITSSDTASESTMRYFRYDKGTLTLLKADGKPYPGNPQDYRFKKK